MTTSRPTSRQTFWLAALAVAALGSWILYDAPPALNWGVWTAAAALGLITSRIRGDRKIEPNWLILLALATLVAFAQSITSVQGHSPIILGLVLILLGLAVITLDDSADALTLPTVVQVPFAAVKRVLLQAASELLQLPEYARPSRSKPLLRGLLITLPVVLLLGALLSSADPLLNTARETMFGWMNGWRLNGRFVFLVVLTVITIGAFALAAGAREQHAPRVADVLPPFLITSSEIRMLLGSVNGLLWLFLGMQLIGLTLDPGAMTGSGITYAEYARRGFAELSIAAAIVLGVILFTETFSQNESRSHRLDLGAIAAVVIILGLAFRRVLLYENAYGFTSDRIFAQAYMLVLGAAFLTLAWDLSRGAVSPSFGRRGMTMTLAAVITCLVWNYEGWVARKNLQRVQSSAPLDLAYLKQLSPAAIPTLVAGLNRIPQPDRPAFAESLRCTKIPAIKHWYEWNFRREQARSALAKLGGSCRLGRARRTAARGELAQEDSAFPLTGKNSIPAQPGTIDSYRMNGLQPVMAA